MGHVKAEEGNVEEGAQWNENLQGLTTPPLCWCCRAGAEGDTLQGFSGFVGSATSKDLELSLDW